MPPATLGIVLSGHAFNDVQQEGAMPNEPLNPGDEASPGTGEDVCRTCNGSGRIDGGECPTCGGTGTVIEGIGGG